MAKKAKQVTVVGNVLSPVAHVNQVVTVEETQLVKNLLKKGIIEKVKNEEPDELQEVVEDTKSEAGDGGAK